MDDAVAAARAVLQRRIGPQAARIVLTLSEGSSEPPPWYDYRCIEQQMHVQGNSAIALVRGAYAGLKASGAMSVSWEGDRVALPERFPLISSGRVTTPFRHRAYLNTCTFGYTTPWWNWARWEREIDWMALHGVDLPLAMEGQEYVWQSLWRAEGLSAADIAAYFSGPAFCPWQRMGNIEGYLAPLSSDWIAKKHALQRQILGRMRELGMQPILPAFGGYVPKAFALAYPRARIHLMRPWSGFRGTYWLDPTDPLFTRIAGRFIALYTEVYGEGRCYLADSFNEMVAPIDPLATGGGFTDEAANKPIDVDPVVRDARLKAYGQAIAHSIQSVRPDAVWVMQGWLFGSDPAFWSAEAITAFLSGAPDDGLMILDIGNDRYADVWKRAGAFSGKPWVYGYVHNYGGSNQVFGDLEFYRSDLGAIVTEGGTGKLSGFGVFPEGLNSNSIVYEYLFDLAWSARPDMTVADWMRTWLRARYGRTTPALEAAWADLIRGAFRTRYWTTRWWRDEAGAYLLFKRPRLDAETYAGEPGDLASLRRGVRALAALAPAFAGERLFEYDLVQMTRHFATLEIDSILPQAIRAYRAANTAHGDHLVARIKALTLSVDHLVGAENDGLAGWIAAARAYADTPADATAYVENAKAQITVWGGNGNLGDYASKAFQGLYRDYYLPRWVAFFDRMRSAAAAGEPVDEAVFTHDIAVWEHEWVRRDTSYRHHRPADPVQAARTLLAMLEQA